MSKYFFQTAVNVTSTMIDDLTVHVLNSTSPNNAFFIEINIVDNCSKIKEIGLYFKKNGRPTIGEYDFNETHFLNSTKSIVRFLSNETIDGLEYYVGIKAQVNGEPIVMNYTFTPRELGCYFYDNRSETWSTDGCTVSSVYSYIITLPTFMSKSFL